MSRRGELGEADVAALTAMAEWIYAHPSRVVFVRPVRASGIAWEVEIGVCEGGIEQHIVTRKLIANTIAAAWIEALEDWRALTGTR